MTSAQLMPSGAWRFAAIGALLALSSCTGPRLVEPTVLASDGPGARLWAVAPFNNESGVSTVDTYGVADEFFKELQQVRGIDAVPVNRVVQAMRAGNIASIASPGDATRLLELLDVDALVVGTVTTWDPYPPPTLGMAVQVFSRAREHPGGIDTTDLVRSARGDASPGALGDLHAVAQAAGVFDGRNHQTLLQLGEYSRGRTEPDGAFGDQIYLMDMTLFTQFVSYRLIHDLLAFQRARETPEEIDTPR